jgi:HAD superfamily hydrolase (TIGR01509 family)
MPKRALFMGSIGTIVETSDLQRQAYNQALKEAGVAWEWDRETYAELLEQSGGRERLEMLSSATGARLTEAQIVAIHARKTAIAGDLVMAARPAPRPGVVALLQTARERGLRTAFVTTTYRPNVDAIFATLAGQVDETMFDHVVTRDDVERGKPAPDAYLAALRALDVAADEAVAVEDTANSVMAAKRAGLVTIATPGAITAGQDFWQADLVVPALANADGTLDAKVLALLD